MELSNCLMWGGWIAFPPCIFLSGPLVRTWRLSTWITNRKQVSLPVTYICRCKSQTNIGSQIISNPLLLRKHNCLEFGACIQSLQESVNCGFNWTMSNLPFFPKQSLSVWLQSFFSVSPTKASFPTELTAAINWLVSAVSDCVTLSSRGCYPVTYCHQSSY